MAYFKEVSAVQSASHLTDKLVNKKKQNKYKQQNLQLTAVYS